MADRDYDRGRMRRYEDEDFDDQDYGFRGRYGMQNRGRRWEEEEDRFGGGYGTQGRMGTRRSSDWDQEYGSQGGYGTRGLYGDTRYQGAMSGRGGCDWNRGYGYQGRFGGYGSQRRRSGRSSMDWERDYDYSSQGTMGTRSDTDWDLDTGYSSYEQPMSVTYTEFWLIPGPFTGVGPRGYQRSDDSIREDINERLTRHGQIDASDIEVDVVNGEATLRGTVDSRREKRLAEDVAESVSGINDVHNELRVRQPQLQDQQQGNQGQ